MAQQTTINGASVSVTLPSEKQSSVGGFADMILVSADYDATASATDVATATSGWTRDRVDTQGSNVLRTAKFKKLCTTTGSGGENPTVTGPGQDAVYTTHVMANHGCTNVSDFTWQAPANNTTGNADPPASGTLTSGLTYSVLAQCNVDFSATGNTVSAGPSGYVGVAVTKSASSTSSCGVGSACKRVVGAGSTENPGTFTNTSRPWLAYTGALKGRVVPPTVFEKLGAEDVDDLKFGPTDESAAYVGAVQTW
jgi:hypothetical protein